MALNIQADEILQNIRKGKREKQYEIPRGGLFELISCANYGKRFWNIFDTYYTSLLVTRFSGAEIIEWSGFAIACWSLPAAAFAWYTFSNIGPRGYKVLSFPCTQHRSIKKYLNFECFIHFKLCNSITFGTKKNFVKNTLKIARLWSHSCGKLDS